MTDKEKAKAYDNAIERAKKLYDNEIIEEIFPELKENDTERIRKNCINFLKLQKQYHAATFEIEECIDWLEKQDKSFSILSNSSNIGKNEQKFVDKNKSKFNVGDWVVFITSESVYQVEKIENYEYTLRHILGGSLCLSFSNEKLIREWTIQDAKDGDVLVCDIDKCEIGGDVEKLPNIVSTIFNFKKLINSRDYIHSYCHLYDKRVLGLQSTMYYNSFVHNISPATKEQRDVLMKAINNAGYEWDIEKRMIRRGKENNI